MKYDIIVIGSGPGGYVAAIRAAQLGRKVAVVERADIGGVCLNWGCIPTKALLKSAQVYAYCKNAAHYGLELEGAVRPDAAKIVARSRGVAETMSKGVQFLFKKNAIDLIAGHGRLAGAGCVDVDGTRYEADHIILATGARPREMPFMPIDGVHVLSSKHALTLDRLPETMIVVGSGAIGSEFAYLYASLGVKVTVVEYLPQLMPLEDEEVSKTMERAFRKLRATVLTSTTVKAVRVNDAGRCEVDVEGKKGAETLTADLVLSAVGIKSNIEEPWPTWLRPRPSAAWRRSAASIPRRSTTRPYRRASTRCPKWLRWASPSSSSARRASNTRSAASPSPPRARRPPRATATAS